MKIPPIFHNCKDHIQISSNTYPNSSVEVLLGSCGKLLYSRIYHAKHLDLLIEKTKYHSFNTKSNKCKDLKIGCRLIIKSKKFLNSIKHFQEKKLFDVQNNSQHQGKVYTAYGAGLNACELKGLKRKELYSERVASYTLIFMNDKLSTGRIDELGIQVCRGGLVAYLQVAVEDNRIFQNCLNFSNSKTAEHTTYVRNWMAQRVQSPLGGLISVVNATYLLNEWDLVVKLKERTARMYNRITQNK